MSSRRIWIVDGHNMIFAIPRLERLQVTGHRNQARADLVGTLRRFAETRRQNVLVVCFMMMRREECAPSRG